MGDSSSSKKNVPSNYKVKYQAGDLVRIIAEGDGAFLWLKEPDGGVHCLVLGPELMAMYMKVWEPKYPRDDVWHELLIDGKIYLACAHQFYKVKT